MMVNWVPCVDGVFMPRQERDLILDGQTKNIDLVVGDTQDEFMVSDGQGHQVRAGREGNRRLIAAWQHGGGRAPAMTRAPSILPTSGSCSGPWAHAGDPCVDAMLSSPNACHGIGRVLRRWAIPVDRVLYTGTAPTCMATASCIWVSLWKCAVGIAAHDYTLGQAPISEAS